jgi:uncharacterized membrane protein (DUF2068 family)
MNSEYKMLHIAPAIFKLLAWASLSLGIISTITFVSGGGLPQTPRWMGFLTLIMGAIYFFIFMVVSDAVRLLLDIRSRLK